MIMWDCVCECAEIHDDTSTHLDITFRKKKKKNNKIHKLENIDDL